MKSMNPHDSSILAFLAQNPSIPKDKLKSLIERIEHEGAKQVALEILEPGAAPNAKTKAQAERLKSWAASQVDVEES